MSALEQSSDLTLHDIRILDSGETIVLNIENTSGLVKKLVYGIQFLGLLGENTSSANEILDPTLSPVFLGANWKEDGSIETLAFEVSFGEDKVIIVDIDNLQNPIDTGGDTGGTVIGNPVSIDTVAGNESLRTGNHDIHHIDDEKLLDSRIHRHLEVPELVETPTIPNGVSHETTAHNRMHIIKVANTQDPVGYYKGYGTETLLNEKYFILSEQQRNCLIQVLSSATNDLDLDPSTYLEAGDVENASESIIDLHFTDGEEGSTPFTQNLISIEGNSQGHYKVLGIHEPEH